MAPRLAAAFGVNENNFPDALSMQCWSGVAPVTRRSGNSKVVLFRWARPKFVHQTFVEFARVSVGWSAWAGEFFRVHRQAGWEAYRIYRALAYKWIRILWRCWKDNTTYDEVQYLRSLQKRGVTTYAALYVQAAETK